MRRLSRAAALLVLCAAPGGCRNDATGPLGGVEDYVFLTQPHDLGVYPDALFEGVVTVDPAGCIRLGASEPDNSTVVWPAGSTLDGEGHAPTIRDRGGAKIGVIGGTFTFGGGHTPNLAAITALTDAEMDAVRDRCPGVFWLVAP
jgi:hypothetical protein